MAASKGPRKRPSRAKKKYSSLADYLDDTKTTQEAFAVRIGVSRTYVSRLASGDRQPALPLALKIEALTGVPAAALVSQAVAS